MGGRGSFSRSHGGVRSSSDGGGSLYISQDVENRADIRRMFIDELGFKELYGTGSIPTAQLGALGIELKKLERQYGVISGGKTYLAVTNKKGVLGAAAQYGDGSTVLFINPSAHSSVSDYRKTLQSSQASGFKTATDGRVTSDFSYTARHEYGHLLQYRTTSETGKSAAQIRNEVQSTAKGKYNASGSNPSRYGATNEREYFAESFASMTGGNPNAHGNALSDWLKRNLR